MASSRCLTILSILLSCSGTLQASAVEAARTAEAAALMQQAVSESRSGKPQEARLTLQKLVNRAPNDIEALKLLAGLDDSLRDYESAYGHYKKIVSKQPTNWEAELGMARCSLQLGHFKQAVDMMKSLAEAHPDEPKIWLNLALAKVATGENDEAEGAAQRAIALGGQSQTALRVLAQIKLDSSQPRFAKELAEIILASQPKNPENYLFVLQCMAYTRSQPQELNDLVDLAETSLPDDGALFYQLGHRGIVHGLVVKPKDSQELQKRKRAWYLVAARSLNLAVLADPKNEKYHMELARLLADLGLNHAAASEAELVRKLNPSVHFGKTLQRAYNQSRNDLAGRLKTWLRTLGQQ